MDHSLLCYYENPVLITSKYPSLLISIKLKPRGPLEAPVEK